MHPATLTLALILAQPAVPGPPSVPGPPAVPMGREPLTYEAARTVAVLQKKALVVFVDVPTRSIAGAVTVGVAEFPEVAGRGIVVSPDGRQRFDLPAGASDAEIAAKIGRGKPSALPFLTIKTAQREVRDVPSVEGKWPARLPRLPGLERYEPTAWTQESFDRNITGRAFISWVSRNQLERKWQVPGGLEHAHGWTSELYRGVNNRKRSWKGPENPGELYSIMAYHRRYDDGAIFADVLRNERGDVFEVRLAEKIDGRWDRYIAYKNKDAQPVGYVPPTRRQCAACHAQAGTGGYGTARVPGGDTIISDPF